MYEYADFPDTVIPRSFKRGGRDVSLEVSIKSSSIDDTIQCGTSLVPDEAQTELDRETHEMLNLSSPIPPVTESVLQLVLDALNENARTGEIFNAYVPPDVYEQPWVLTGSYGLASGRVTALEGRSGAKFVVGSSTDDNSSLRLLSSQESKSLPDLVTAACVSPFNKSQVFCGLLNGEVTLLDFSETSKESRSSTEGHKEAVVACFWLAEGIVSVGAEGRLVLWNSDHLVPIAGFTLLGQAKKPLLSSNCALNSEFLFVATENGKIVRTQLGPILRATPAVPGAPDTVLRLTEIEGFAGVLGARVAVSHSLSAFAAAGGRDLKVFKIDQQKPFLVSSFEDHVNSVRWLDNLLLVLTDSVLHVIDVTVTKRRATLLIPIGGEILANDQNRSIAIGAADVVKTIKLSSKLSI